MIISEANTDLSQIDFEAGCVIPIDKKVGWTSFDVVNKLRNPLPVKKVGHAGTLDPLATGLVLICTGKYTKRLNELMGMEKEYTGTITLGQTTPSYDLETPLTKSGDPDKVTQSEIDEVVKQFQGSIMQVPPAYSAIKIDGQRAYKKARKKENLKMMPREVNIMDFYLTDMNNPDLHFYLKCSKGTYVRSLAHDLGKELGVGGHLSELRRVSIGSFKVESAWDVNDFVSAYRNLQP